MMDRTGLRTAEDELVVVGVETEVEAMDGTVPGAGEEGVLCEHG
jgi:hypothetical protein